MELILSPSALKAIAGLPRREAVALMRKLQAFAVDPGGAHPWATTLRGQNNRTRVRQGDWRAILLIARERETVIVERIGNRKEVYR